MKKISILLLLISISLFIPVENIFGLQNGLIQGQWVRYEITPIEIDATNELVRIELARGLEKADLTLFGIPFQGNEWIEIEIFETSGSSFVVERSFKAADGTVTDLGQLEFSISSSDTFPLAIPIDTNLGESIPANFMKLENLIVKTIQERNYGGEKISAFKLVGTQLEEIDSAVAEFKIVNHYDQETGILLEFKLETTVADPLIGSATAILGIKAIEISKSDLGNISEGGCLIATATFGSELATTVQELRELRDSTLLQTASGTSFMAGFNQLYYSFSPTIADWERENPIFKETVKLAITPLLSTLSILNYVEIDSEEKVLGFGIGIILLNIGMYFAAPFVVISKMRSKILTYNN